jgi:hypothetical protein
MTAINWLSYTDTRVETVVMLTHDNYLNYVVAFAVYRPSPSLCSHETIMAKIMAISPKTQSPDY